MNPLIVIDLETGGFFKEKNPITEIAFSVVDMKTMKIIETYQNYVKPYDGLIIEKDALDSTQLTMKEINGGISIDKMLQDFAGIMTKHKKSRSTAPILVGHNLDHFDLPYLEYTFSQRNKNIYDYIDESTFDTIKLAKMYERSIPGADKFKYKLEIVCERYEIKLTGAHGAAADVDATYRLFKTLMKNYKHGGERNSRILDAQEIPTKSRKFFEFSYNRKDIHK